MNAHSPIIEARATKRADEAMAMLRLAATQRRIARTNRDWALEAERDGKLEDYRRYRKEAERLWSDAQWYEERAAP